MKLIKGIVIGCLALTLTACSNNKEEPKVSLSEAKSIALKHANLTEDKVKFGETNGNTVNDVYIYDIEFVGNDGTEYDYQINGETGDVIEYDHDTKDNNQATSQNNLTMQQAKDIALKHANVKEADVSFTETKEDTDDGIKVYEMKFNNSDKSYEYEVNLQTGEIRSYEHTKKKASTSTQNISLDEAKSIALKDAKVTDTSTKFIQAKEDKEDGIVVYELEFQKGNQTYSYEIEKATRDIVSYKVK